MIRLLCFLFACIFTGIVAQAQVGPLGVGPTWPFSSGNFKITDVGVTTGTGATITLSSLSIPAGSLIIVSIGDETPGGIFGTLSDSASNSYTDTGTQTDSASGFIDIQYFNNNATTVTSITYTPHSSGNRLSLSVFYVTGQAASSVEDTAVRASSSPGTSTTSCTLVSGTPAQSGELFVALVTIRSAGGSWTQDSGNGWTAPPDADIGPSDVRLAGGHVINFGVGTKTWNPTWPNSSFWACYIRSFKHG